MNYGDIRDDWKLNEIERTANEAKHRLHELDAMRESLASLERSFRQLSADHAELRSRVETTENQIHEIDRRDY